MDKIALTALTASGLQCVKTRVFFLCSKSILVNQSYFCCENEMESVEVIIIAHALYVGHNLNGDKSPNTMFLFPDWVYENENIRLKRYSLLWNWDFNFVCQSTGIFIIVCKDAEIRRQGEVRFDRSETEQSRGMTSRQAESQRGNKDDMERKGSEGQRQRNGENKRKMDRKVYFLDINSMLKVHLSMILSPHSPSDWFRKQQAIMSKVRARCR